VVLIAVGVLLLVVAAVWRWVAVPVLARFPTDLDRHLRYEGTFTLFVDPATAAPLSEPRVSALAVDRRVQALPGESSANRVVVRETITFTIEGTAPATQVHQYAMDRSTGTNVADDRAWAFEEANVLDRSGAYWVTMPRAVDDTSAVPMFKDEIGGVFTATAGPLTEERQGLTLIGFSASGTVEPLSDAYLRALAAVSPLPATMTFDQLKPSLVAAGVPVDAAMAALPAVASPEDLAALVAMTQQPIPLEYVDTFTGQTFVETRTGAIVDVTSVVERISARPSGEALPPLLGILERYQQQPDVAAAIDSLDRLSSEPLPLFEYRYAQTPASVDDTAAWVADQRDRLQLAERTIPLALAGAGAALMLSGVVVALRRRTGGAD
jgi:hypothetical protein